ncbi:hypothetical protein AbraIFM66951_002875 [Aspergillus brasiliensis]|uniref:Alkaline protease 1 n=1 Tax=Aspergillus brasiliensis TaxID=319629 RepID=A0A9W5YNW2_9EURO|nr:hypothetical protein AbraCBS73388_004412 [Aspergillus brasiliensis]GKZ50028.1 hypothetical protein AbraIFM66951_002875 [Aspergillus brasiliensis]
MPHANHIDGYRPIYHTVEIPTGGNTEAEDDDEEEEDQDEDSDHEEAEPAASTPIHDELQYIVECAKENPLPDKDQASKESHQEALRRFKQRAKSWKHLGGRSEQTGECILHMMLDEDNVTEWEVKQLARTMRWIIRTHPDLLHVPNDDNMAPMHAALHGLRGQRRNKNRVYLITNGLFPSTEESRQALRGELIQVIEATCGRDQENCLHVALRSQRNAKVLKLLLDHASPKAINDVDKHGRTPLHRAVEFQHASEEALVIVKQLITKGDTELDGVTPLAFDTPHEDGEMGPGSIYLYQESMRTKQLAALEQVSPLGKGASGKGSSRPEPKSEDKRDPAALRPQEPTRKEVPSQPQRVQPDKSKTSAIRAPAEAKEDSKEESFRLHHSARANTGAIRTNQTASGHSVRKDEIEEKRKWSNKIQQELKLHCLRTRSIKQATRFLYGPNRKNIQLYFDYRNMPEEADALDFYENFRETEFDEVLQYVVFPPVRLRNHDSIHIRKYFPESHEFLDSVSAERKDLLFFFLWLKKKKVKHIIHLTVDDYKDPHDDEVIHKCLSGLRVDVLDWSKPDLDPEMLCAACPEVRELHLRWGGNNAILRAWGEPDGLRTLPCLRKIHLYYNKNLGKCEAKAKRFETRINTPVPSMQPDPTERGQDGLDQNEDRSIGNNNELEIVHIPDWHPGAKPTAHKWLAAIAAFTGEFKTIMHNMRKKRLQNKDNEVRVALIDDGVHFTGQEFRGKLINGKSFGYEHDRGTLREKQWYVSDTGHGTTMARLILQVCPFAKIYPIKLDTVTNPHSGTVEIKTESAIRAIDAAVDQGVDIISMSWTVDVPQEPARTAFDKALSSAAAKKILMFCSSSDNGRFTEAHYPSAWSQSKLIRIGACMANGSPYDWVNPEKIDFLLPGVEVVLQNTAASVYKWSGSADDKHAETGSSVSTALAAGLAALVFCLVKIGVQYATETHQSDGLDANDLERLRDITVLKHAFRNLGGISGGANDKFIEIWQALDITCYVLRTHRGATDADVTEARRAIHMLGRNLIPKA